ncbi:MAG TPA: type II toxin-antitoxin system VapC family toxin [Thermoanaerobaculia bacterium]|nr:type II toxin-antitoxin system VapC family toxin [Thermoanaerobaculia bacterium]
MTFVVDASVVLRWFVAQEPGAAEAAHWLEKFAEDADLLVAPDLLRFELLGALARLQLGRSMDWATKAFSRFERLGLRLLPTDEQIAQRALQLSRELRIAGWDAVYLAHAESLNTSWVTGDERILRRLSGDPRLEALVARS